MDSTRVPPVRQEPFDAIPCSVQDRTDLIGNAKRLYAALCSAHRMGWQPTYQQLADRLGASERSIVRWVQRLTDAGLIAVRRRGQGLANLFTVLALVTSGHDSQPRPAAPAWRGPTRSPSFNNKQRSSGIYSRIPQSASAYTVDAYGRNLSRLRR